MNYRVVSTIAAVLMLGLTFNLFAQVVDVPDPALNRLIRETLDIRANRPITRDDMLSLKHLDAGGNIGITNLTGLEHATNIIGLGLYHNPISDISAMSNMTLLQGFNLWGCQVADIGPLENLHNLQSFVLGNNRIIDLRPLSGLIQLQGIELESNRIVDVRPLATLINLTRLELDHNQIVDFSPLARLVNLEVLWINDNRGTDFTPLQGLTLIEFKYDEVCDMSPMAPSIKERLESRSYPSIVQAWSDVVGLPHLTSDERNELHDLHFSQSFGLDWDITATNTTYGVATTVAGDVKSSEERQMRKLRSNPDMIFLVEIRLHNHFALNAFPPDSQLWLRNSSGQLPQLQGGEYMINFLLPEVQELLVNRILAIERCGIYDGVFLDGFANQGTGFVGRNLYQASDEEMIQAYLNIFDAVRSQARDDFLILLNVNQSKPTLYAQYINGVFMESFKDYPGGYTLDWLLVHEDVLSWAEDNLREPRINCLYGEGMSIEPPDGLNNLRWMKMFTTLSLTHSNGYVLYTDGQRDSAVWLEIPHHAHLWYDFWNTDLGQPVGPKAQLYKDTEGVFIREFTNGWAVYNRSGKAQVIEFAENVSSVTSGLSVTKHAVPDLDGDMFLRAKPKNPADVNRDGVVNILDLTLVAQGFGTDKPEADVNGDGFVNILDLVFVANQF